MGTAKERGLNNLEVVTADVNAFKPDQYYDRVVSVEMFEHVRNHRQLFQQIFNWLNPGGKLFTHVFCHRSTSYPFEVEGEDDWMSKHFFSGGTMPADELFLRICGGLELESRWRWSGSHYAETSEDWLRNLDQNKSAALRIFENDQTPVRGKENLPPLAHLLSRLCRDLCLRQGAGMVGLPLPLRQAGRGKDL